MHRADRIMMGVRSEGVLRAAIGKLIGGAARVVRSAVLLGIAPLALAAAPAAAGDNPLAVGQMANFTFLDVPEPVDSVAFVDGAGIPRTLGDFRGRVVLVNLWATWCAPCRREMPSLDRLQKALGGQDFTVLALAQDRKGLDAVRRFLDEIGVANLEPYVDATARSARRFGAVGLPTTVLLDRSGRIIGRLVGPAEWDSAEAQHLVRQIIAGAAGG
jgi:thiol-disulfide isomerase/thioredoxin